MGLCILLYVSPSSHKEDTVAQEITTQTFPQETAALPGCSPTDNRWGVWHEFVVKKWPYQNWVLLFYSIVALLNIDFWAWDKPTTFGPDSCSTGLLEAWTLPSRETRPSALRFVGMERHDSETNSSDLLKNPRKYEKKQKVCFKKAETKKTPQAKPGFACWGARWALYWQKSITTGYPAHSFACFSILQLSPNTPLDENPSQTPHEI